MTPPLRFVLAIVGGWGCLRAALLVPGDAEPPSAAVRHMEAPTPAGIVEVVSPPARLPAASGRVRAHWPSVAPSALMPQARTRVFEPASPPPSPPSPPLQLTALPAALPQPREAQRPELIEPRRPRAPSRWSLSAWAFARRGDDQGLASGGTLGGSQIGVKLSYRLRGSARAPLSLTARFSSPIRRRHAAEAAVGVEWQPSPAIPVRLVAERRQAIGPEGRSAFGLGAHGGVAEVPVAAGFRLDAYGQAGVVGLRSRDAYVDGAARLSRPLGRRLSVGVGAWGAAQPGVSRLDVGPSVSLALPEARARLTLDWRVLARGEARPGSGPALTLSTGF